MKVKTVSIKNNSSTVKNRKDISGKSLPMKTFGVLANPFTIHTPEKMPPEQVVDLFVDVLTDFPKIHNVGHLFLHGPRGSGKSMIFRYLEPDCQCLANKLSANELPFYSILVPVKLTNLNRTELKRLEGKHASIFINEHFMVMYIAEIILESLSKLYKPKPNELKVFMKNVFFKLLQNSGWTTPTKIKRVKTDSEYINIMKDISQNLRFDISQYMKKLSFPDKEVIPYPGPLCSYTDFLYPLLCSLKTLSFIPNSPIFLLIDDADCLSLIQRQILNTWVSSRTSSEVSLKISTQLRYQTFRTVTGQSIQTPHDFTEVNIVTTYTASSTKSRYKERMEQIIGRRLSKIAGVNISPNAFFPEDIEQENKIHNIYEQIKEKWESEGKGYRAGDDAYRYARPDYIKSLGGQSKGTYLYRYAGFDQLVHISSGIVRNFLDSAAEMFSEMKSQNADKNAQCIPPIIQDAVVRKKAEEFLFNEFEKLRDDRSHDAPPLNEISKLYNLIQSLGGIFYKILISERSERRVFSIAISGTINDEEIRKVLSLGTELGYFHKSSIGNKEGTGRTPLYILSRVLAPHFKLDPTSFAGYLFVNEDDLRLAMTNSRMFIDRRLKDNKSDVGQMRLFE